MPKLVYIRVSSVGDVNLCAKIKRRERSYSKRRDLCKFAETIFNDFGKRKIKPKLQRSGAVETNDEVDTFRHISPGREHEEKARRPAETHGHDWK